MERMNVLRELENRQYTRSLTPTDLPELTITLDFDLQQVVTLVCVVLLELYDYSKM